MVEMFDDMLICFAHSPGLLDLVDAAIVVAETDFAGVHIAARNLAADFARVTSKSPNPVEILTSEQAAPANAAGTAIIVGSIESSLILQRLEQDGKLDFGKIRGNWESYQTSVVNNPFDGCHSALVIAGSDKRGAIFGVYSLSEQLGVSPWYWWADVPPKSHSEIYALPVITVQAEPSIRFRGIFINDEAPALTSWVHEKFGKYGAAFYAKVFELLLRLKANFLWPAMWPGYPNPGASFFVDDPKNQKMAEEYGICVSTSHHEPMQRLSNEWFADNPDGSWNWLTNKQKITEFFDEGVRRAKGCESYFTLGMRGEYDRKMATSDPAAIVREVIQTQRAIIKDIHGREDAVPQLLALYKEVQEQYESGRLDVPDDVTLLFADDNFGTIRRLPSGKESRRKGGAGIYYHFEYVGDPRSYKWTNSNSLGKTWHQLQEAHRRGARQIWIFNVGDIKPLEIPMTFVMALAWDINSIKADGFVSFFSILAERKFGQEYSKEIGAVWHEYDRLISLRRHEHVEPQSFSLLHYNEAETILGRWKALLADAEAIYSRISQNQCPSVFQLVVHPIKASYIFVALHITLGRNQLYARQRRNSANSLAQEVLKLFDLDFRLSEEYHELLERKWNHVMRQPHYGFGDTWHAPSRDMVAGLCYVQRRQNSNPVVGQMGIAVEGHEGVRPGRCNEESDRTHPSRRDLIPGLTLGTMTRYGPKTRWFDIYTRGAPTINWTAHVPYDWIRLSATAGSLVPGEDDARIEIAVDWDQVPPSFNQQALITIRSTEGDFEQIHLPLIGRQVPETFKSGFVEGDGFISIPASSCVIKSQYRALPDVGRSVAGSVMMHSTPDQSLPYLLYDFYVFTEGSTATLLLYFNLTLDLDPTHPMEYDIQVDREPPHTYRIVLEPVDVGGLPDGWSSAVQACVWVRKHTISKGSFESGKHTIKLRLNHSNIILDKLVVDLGGTHTSYLGPPPSFCIRNV